MKYIIYRFAILLSILITFSSCDKEANDFTSKDDFYEMTGSNTLSRIYYGTDEKLRYAYEYENSLLKRRNYYSISGSLLEYATYEFNENNQIAKISYFEQDNTLICYYSYEYDSELLLIKGSLYSSNSGQPAELDYTYVPIYDDENQLIKINFYGTSGLLFQYDLYFYNENGDISDIEYYDGNDNYYGAELYEYDDAQAIESKMYRFPWSSLHNITKFTDTDGTVYTYTMVYNDNNFPIKMTTTVSGSTTVKTYEYN